MMKLKLGERIYAKNHADFLNKTFGTHYKGWFRCTWNYQNNPYVWMVRFNNSVDGWTNTFITDRVVLEEHEPGIFPGSIDELYIEQFFKHDRLLFEIVEFNDPYYTRVYVFQGVFRYNWEASDPYKTRYYYKIADEVEVVNGKPRLI